jgi:5'(3')-deoxyribonucleotidase
MEILIDMDGIVTDTLPAWLDRIHQQTGVRAYQPDITKWNLNENPALKSVKPQVMWDILDEPGFTFDLKPMPDAVYNLHELHEEGHNLSIVTARYGKHCIPETIEWIAHHMP